MKFNQLLDRKESKQLEMIQILMEQGGICSIKKLMDEVDLSKSSVLTYLSALQQVIVDHKLNCLLTIEKEAIQWSMALDVHYEHLASILYHDSLQTKILLYLLKNQEYSVISLSTKLAISESTLTRKIKEINLFLKEFQLTIWQGKLVGEELQIRYFYYLLCQNLSEFSSNREKTELKNERLVAIYEKAFSLNFTQEKKQKLDWWITICKYRLSASNKLYSSIRMKMDYYQKDPLYLKMREVIPRALAHYAVSIDPEETMIQFVALVGLNFLPEEAIYQYSLERSRFSPTALVDTIVNEKIFSLYQGKRIKPEMEQSIYLSLISIHFHLFFFEGEVEWEKAQAIWHWEESYTFRSYHTYISKIMTNVLTELDCLESPMSQQRMTEIKYLSLIRKVEQTMTQIYRIGLSFRGEEIFKEVIVSYFQAQLGKIAEVVVESYVSGERYDLVISNYSMNGKEEYLFSGSGSNYDFEQIFSQIKRLEFK